MNALRMSKSSRPLAVVPRRPRLLHRSPSSPQPSSREPPPRHVKRWKCSEPATWTTPSDSLVATDPRYGTVTVTAWHGVHPRLLCRGHWSAYQAPPIVKGSAIRVEVEHLPRPTGRTKKTLWLWWSGEGEPDLPCPGGERDEVVRIITALRGTRAACPGVGSDRE